MDIAHVAQLAKLTLSHRQLELLMSNFQAVLQLINHIQQLDTANSEASSQVTGLTNVVRPDVIDTSRMLTQAQALANAPAVQGGYFKAPAVFSQP